jgi:hypothetical protein
MPVVCLLAFGLAPTPNEWTSLHVRVYFLCCVLLALIAGIVCYVLWFLVCRFLLGFSDSFGFGCLSIGSAYNLAEQLAAPRHSVLAGSGIEPAPPA